MTSKNNSHSATDGSSSTSTSFMLDDRARIVPFDTKASMLLSDGYKGLFPQGYNSWRMTMTTHSVYSETAKKKVGNSPFLPTVVCASSLSACCQ